MKHHLKPKVSWEYRRAQSKFMKSLKTLKQLEAVDTDPSLRFDALNVYKESLTNLTRCNIDRKRKSAFGGDCGTTSPQPIKEIV